MIFVEAIVDAYHKAGLPGRYKVVRRQNGIQVVPSEVTGFSGGMKTITPIMSRPITIPYAERSADETLQLIADAISKAAEGRKVNLLMNPFNPEMTPRVAMSASGSSITDALSDLGAKTGRHAVSYLLAFEPNEQSYYLTVTAISPDHPAGPGHREPGPTTQTP